ESYTLATDLADYLVKKGAPFREAHSIVGKLVRHALSQEKSLQELPLADYQSLSPLFGEDVYSITVESSLDARDAPGGTAPRQVARALKRARERLQE
ncbi:argininosuccinate lyase, partial [Dehalococcoidia bacterium]|nr:argininosuccinate lyase [Dehalococcoidia bacterium]